MNMDYKLSIKRLSTCLLSLIVVGIFISGCSTKTDVSLGWQFAGLKDSKINKIILFPNGLVLATQDGVYMVNGKTFQRMGLKNEEVIDVLLLGEKQMIAGTQSSDFSSAETTLFKTTDGGASWQPFMGNYGGEERKYTSVSALAVHPHNTQILFARGGTNVAKSVNGGQSWKSVFLDWETWGGMATFVKIDPKNPNIIWAGGSNGVFQPTLFKSKDGGNNWVRLETLKHIEAVINDIAINPNNSDKLLIGMGGIIRSFDGGQSWEIVFGGASILTMTGSAQNSGTVYASGINATRSLFFIKTDDFGNSWEEITFEDSPAGVRVNDMISVIENGREVLYFGTNKGVFSYRFER